MTSYGFKGGIGTASRVTDGAAAFVVGVLVNANHGARRQLTIAGVPVGAELEGFGRERRRPSSSIVMIAATNAPLEPRQLERLATRLGLGLARTGATANTSSGDLMLAFSTAPPDVEAIDDERMTALYQAAVEATEEAVLNAPRDGGRRSSGGRLARAGTPARARRRTAPSARRDAMTARVVHLEQREGDRAWARRPSIRRARGLGRSSSCRPRMQATAST
jgi:D-aminopeptidase